LVEFINILNSATGLFAFELLNSIRSYWLPFHERHPVSLLTTLKIN